MGGEGGENYMMGMDFIGERNDLFMEEMKGGENRKKVWIGRMGGGGGKNMVRERDGGWVERKEEVRWVKNNS